MKTLATALALLLLASCATNDGFIDTQNNQCAPGSPIELQAGFLQSTPADRVTRAVTFAVEVTNLTDSEVTLQSVRFDSASSQGQWYTYELEGRAQDVGKTIAEGDSTIVEIPTRITLRDRRSGAVDTQQNPNQELSAAFDVSVTAVLEGGENHRCRFRVPANF